MIAQTRLANGILRALVAASSLGVVALGAAFSFTPEAEAVRPNIIRDWCTGTSGGGEGLECNSANDLLIRTQNPDGTCGAWVCCPPNGDGTYNCDQGSSPGGSQLNSTVGNFTGPRATTVPGPAVNPGPTQRSPRATRRTRRVN